MLAGVGFLVPLSTPVSGFVIVAFGHWNRKNQEEAAEEEEEEEEEEGGGGGGGIFGPFIHPIVESDPSDESKRCDWTLDGVHGVLISN